MKSDKPNQERRPFWSIPVLRRGVRRIIRDQSAATAVEFALVAMPFLFMIMSVFELALVFTVATSLDSATAKAARQIRTGQLQTSGGATASTFAQSICNNLGWLSSQCTGNLSVDVRTFTSFGNVTPVNPVSNGAFSTNNLTFNMGNAGDIVLVRAYYQWTLFTPFLNGGLQALSNGKTVVTSTVAFRNEPYVAS
jgi:Flp pilus assembly protein TadG